MIARLLCHILGHVWVLGDDDPPTKTCRRCGVSRWALYSKTI